MVGETVVEVRPSARRTRTVAARWEGATLVVMTPLRLSARETDAWVDRMLTQAVASRNKRTPSDAKLLQRANELNASFFGGRAVPTSVRWSSRQQHRWGSCTHLEGSIRLSTSLQGMPAWVVDAVLVHELAHLVHADHSPAFRSLVDAYPDTARAMAFLSGVVHGARLRGEGIEVPEASC